MKTFATVLALGLFAVTNTVYAQDGEIGGATLGAYLESIRDFINVYLIPFLFAIAFIVFIWGVFQYFIAGGANEEQRDKGKQLVMWGIIGFVIMVSVWGLINLVTNTLNFDDSEGAPSLPTFDPAD
jgi:hypothetical protein